jgi:PAS domain S-box-containing protein
LKVAKQCLELQGPFQVDTAGSVEEAFSRLKEKEYDAVVSDYQMPGKDGLEFLEALRKNGNTIPFIMFTGRGREEVAIRALNLGASRYLNKTGETETVYMELAHAITELAKSKKAEEQVKQLQEYVLLQTDRMPIGSIVWDTEFRVKTWNPSATRIFGFPEKEVFGKHPYDFMVPKQAQPHMDKIWSRLLEGDEAAHSVNENLTKDGRTIICAWSNTPLKKDDGTVIGVLSMIQDITESKKAEAALLDAKEKWVSLTENTDDIIMIVDGNGIIQFINRTIPPYTPEETIGKTVYEYVPREQHDAMEKSLREVFKTGKPDSYEVTSNIPKIGTVWFSTKVVPVRHDGKVSSAILISANVTERKKAEKETENMAKFPAQNPEPVLRIGSDGRLLYANQAGQNMLEESQSKKILTLIEKLRRHAADALSSDERLVFEEEHDGRTFLFNVVPVASERYANLYATDTTETKKAEKSRRASEERYKSYIEVTGQLGWTTNANGEVEEDIPAWSKFTGQSHEEVKGWGWTKALHPDDLERATQIWKKAVATKSTYDVEYRIRRYDGVYRYFLARGVPVLEKDGKILEWVGTCTDVTERKKAEQALKESEEKYRGLVELAPDGMVAVNAEGIITSANRSFLALVGCDSEEEIVGKPFTKLESSRAVDIPKFQEMFSSLMKGESTSSIEFSYVRRDGTSRWAEVHPGLLLKDGKPAGAQVIVRDVSERKNAEKLTQENQRKFEQLFIANPEAAVYVDPNERVLDANPRFTELFGYSLDEVKGRFLDDFVVPEDRKQEALMLAQKGREGYVYHETARKNKDGSLIRVTISSAPIVLQGQHLGDIVLYKDITERKKAEEERCEATEKIHMMNEKLRVVGGLTRHDVRNKLSTITGNTYLLRKQLGDNKEVLEKLRDMETAVSQVTRILDFTKNYEMLGVEELTYIDVQKSVNEAVQLFSDLKGVRVLNECDGLTVLSDSLLRQLFYNLIDNSLKYGEKLTQIRIHYEKSENQLRLVYEDDGVGISKDNKAKLFNEGFTTGKGSGYGLYLTRRIMEVYGWTIEENGEPGKGARFAMTVPRMNTSGRDKYKIAQ